jgi:hypothetical protein
VGLVSNLPLSATQRNHPHLQTNTRRGHASSRRRYGPKADVQSYGHATPCRQIQVHSRSIQSSQGSRVQRQLVRSKVGLVQRQRSEARLASRVGRARTSKTAGLSVAALGSAGPAGSLPEGGPALEPGAGDFAALAIAPVAWRRPELASAVRVMRGGPGSMPGARRGGWADLRAGREQPSLVWGGSFRIRPNRIQIESSTSTQTSRWGCKRM